MLKAKINKNFRGFTLVEVMVAAIIFVIFVVAMTNIFIMVQSSQRFLSSFSLVVDNLSFSLEKISRELRMGSDFSLDGNGWLHFVNSQGEDVIYRLNHYSIERSNDNGNTFLPITGENVKVESLKFVLSGQGKGDNLQPKITISIKFTSKGGRPIEAFTKTVQTTISARKLDI